jgi:hypothetical protein
VTIFFFTFSVIVLFLICPVAGYSAEIPHSSVRFSPPLAVANDGAKFKEIGHGPLLRSKDPVLPDSGRGRLFQIVF